MAVATMAGDLIKKIKDESEEEDDVESGDSGGGGACQNARVSAPAPPLLLADFCSAYCRGSADLSGGRSP